MTMRLRMSVVMLAAALALAGCGTLEPGGVYRGDKVLYDADVVIATSYDVIHTFVAWEYANREALASRPEVRRAADRMRAGAREWIGTALALRDAYAAQPADGTRDALQSALDVLRAALVEATRYLTTERANDE